MKTFTARQLDRETTRVLDACDRQGTVQIRRRNGRLYTLRVDHPKKNGTTLGEWIEERRRRTKELFKGYPPMTKKETAEFDRMIAGE